jgi:UDP-GlcNAc:undecaprenyl-phosphate/decaprenyl-phosphate GlcNAc-1-phosphate transferase
VEFEFLYLFPVFLTCLLLFYLRPVARRIELVDRPGARKHHTTAVPLIGGISISIAFFLSLLLFDVPFGHFRLLFFCLAAILVVGVLDDLKDIQPIVKLLCQFVIGGVIVYGAGINLSNINDMLLPAYPIGFGLFSAPITILAIVGAINAFNMIDGHDGLAGSCAIVTLLALLFLYKFSNFPVQQGYLILLTLAIVLVCSFLLFNIPVLIKDRNKAFLGDAGSMFLGLFIIYIILDFIQQDVSDRPIFTPAAALWIFGLPLIDLIRVTTIRLKSNHSPFRAGRDHLHHILLQNQNGPFSVLVILVGIHLIAVTIAILGVLYQWPSYILFWGFLLTVLLSILFFRPKHSL